MTTPLAWTALCLNITVYAACPFFRRTRKGLLTLHWSVVNALTWVSMEGPKTTDPSEMRDVLVASATLALLLENRYELSPPTGNLLTRGQATRFIALIALVDAGIWCLYSDVRTMLRALLLCALVALFAWDSFLPRATFEEMNYEIMQVDNYCVWYCLYVGSSLASALFVWTPALVGGLVQAVKRTGFFIVQYLKSCTPHQSSPVKDELQMPLVDDDPESEQYKLENVI